jgi:hypothetical protein
MASPILLHVPWLTPKPGVCHFALPQHNAAPRIDITECCYVTTKLARMASPILLHVPWLTPKPGVCHFALPQHNAAPRIDITESKG